MGPAFSLLIHDRPVPRVPAPWYPPQRNGRMQPFGCIRPNDMGGCNRLVVSAHLLNISRGHHSAIAISRNPNSEFYQKPTSAFRLPSILSHKFRCRAPPYVLSVPTPPYALLGTAVLVISMFVPKCHFVCCLLSLLVNSVTLVPVPTHH